MYEGPDDFATSTEEASVTSTTTSPSETLSDVFERMMKVHSRDSLIPSREEGLEMSVYELGFWYVIKFGIYRSDKLLHNVKEFNRWYEGFPKVLAFKGGSPSSCEPHLVHEKLLDIVCGS